MENESTKGAAAFSHALAAWRDNRRDGESSNEDIIDIMADMVHYIDAHPRSDGMALWELLEIARDRYEQDLEAENENTHNT